MEVETVHTGHMGRPPIYIDPDFLQWVYAHQSTSGIAWFLHVGQRTVQNTLLNYEIAESQDNSFSLFAEELEEELLQDTLLDPNILWTTNMSIDVLGAQLLNSIDLRSIGPMVSFTGCLSTKCTGWPNFTTQSTFPSGRHKYAWCNVVVIKILSTLSSNQRVPNVYWSCPLRFSVHTDMSSSILSPRT